MIREGPPGISRPRCDAGMRWPSFIVIPFAVALAASSGGTRPEDQLAVDAIAKIGAESGPPQTVIHCID